MKVPSFLKLDNNTLYYNENDGSELAYYIPEAYFAKTSKTAIAKILGSIVSTLGIFDWVIVDKNGKLGKFHLFKFPTVFLCKPNRIEKIKEFSINGARPVDYRVLYFTYGDEAVCNINVPQVIDNVEVFFNMMIVVSNRMPNTIPYDHLQDYFPESMSLNAKGYGLNMQLFGMLISEICRDPDDITRSFRLSKMKSMTDYRQISIKQVPKFISPYMALTSDNWDESLMSAITLSASNIDAESPIERVVTGEK